MASGFQASRRCQGVDFSPALKKIRDESSAGLIFVPGLGKLPPPEVLAAYAQVDPEYPSFLRETCNKELKRNFIFQMSTWIGAILFGSILVGAATFLAYTDHPKIASAIVGVNMISVIIKLLAKATRAKLNESLAP